MRPRLIYLHGFASSPGSNKARRFCRALEGRALDLDVPDLNEGGFAQLTISRQLEQLRRLAEAGHSEPTGERASPLLLVGSSLGGYTAALFASGRDDVSALVLMAPAFDFAARWRQRLGPGQIARWERQGRIPVMHYAYDRELEIDFELMRDAARHPGYPEVRCPTLILHGRDDETIPLASSERYARGRSNVELVALESDHSLASAIDEVVARSLAFFAPWIGEPAGAS